MIPTPDAVRDRLAVLRLTQAEAARLIGVDARTVRKWLSGERGVPEPVWRLLSVLDVPEVRARLEYRASCHSRPMARSITATG